MSQRARINKILPSSFIDGPGNRMVIFFQGCNLDCLYCHNFHTIGDCNLCGECVSNCPTNSLKIVNQNLIHTAQTCNSCDSCIKNCPNSSSPFSTSYSLNELILEVVKYASFISGITLSGGEVMLQYKFVLDFLNAIKAHPKLSKLSILIDSNVNCSQKHIDYILPYCEGFMVDLKAMDNEVHKKLTGAENKQILSNINYLYSQSKLKEIRCVMVKGFNTQKPALQNLKHYLSSFDQSVIKRIIKMRKHGARENRVPEELTDIEFEKIKRFLLT